MTKSRSSSERCAVETIDSRGRPSGARSMRVHVERLALPPALERRRGEQVVERHHEALALLARERGLERAARRSCRTAGRRSRRSAPPGREPLPARQPRSTRVARKTAGGDWSGSASTCTRPRRPDTIDWISSRRSSSAESKGTAGASSDCSTLSGTPALEPGRVDRPRRGPAASAAMSAGPRPHSARPFFHVAAVVRGRRLHVLARRAARPRRRSTARTTAASRSSKSSSRFARSPFGSIAMTGTPWRSSSSRRTMARPVLPEPVMPTIEPVGQQVGGVELEPRAGLAAVGVDLLSEVEPVAHRASCRGSRCRPSLREYMPRRTRAAQCPRRRSAAWPGVPSEAACSHEPLPPDRPHRHARCFGQR